MRPKLSASQRRTAAITSASTAQRSTSQRLPPTQSGSTSSASNSITQPSSIPAAMRCRPSNLGRPQQHGLMSLPPSPTKSSTISTAALQTAANTPITTKPTTTARLGASSKATCQIKPTPNAAKSSKPGAKTTCSPAANTTTQSNAARKWASSSTPQNDQGVPQIPNDDLAKLKAAGTTYARAAAGYDDAHKDRLISKITAAIFNTSLLSDCNAAALRTGETADALATLLAFTLAMSPD